MTNVLTGEMGKVAERNKKAEIIMKSGVIYHKLTKELYINHKKVDKWPDRRIRDRYGMHNNELNAWKKANFTKEELSDLTVRKYSSSENLALAREKKLEKAASAEVKENKPKVRQAEVKTFDKELKQALAELNDLKKENENLFTALKKVRVEANENRIAAEKANNEIDSLIEKLAQAENDSELNNLKAACSDLESENNELERKLIEKDYEITNLDYALKSLNQKFVNYQKENASLKELVRLWI